MKLYTTASHEPRYCTTVATRILANGTRLSPWLKTSISKYGMTTPKDHRFKQDHRYIMSAEEKANYSNIFRKVKTDDGYLSGRKAVLLLRKSGLPQGTLARVWALADEDTDGRLSVEEFCTAMHLIRCVASRGLPLPGTKSYSRLERSTPSAKNKEHRKKRTDWTGNRAGEITAKSPKRRSRMASLLGDDPPSPPPRSCDTDRDQSRRTSDAGLGMDVLHQKHEQDEDRQVTDCEEGCVIRRHQNESPRPNDVRVAPNRDKKYEVDSPAIAKGIDSKEKPRRSRALPRRRRPNLNLRLLNPKHVDAVFAEGRETIKSLRDIQSSRVFAMGLQRLSAKDTARWVPVQLFTPRRYTFPQLSHNEQGSNKCFLPGQGRRTSNLLTGYEPSALFLKHHPNQTRVATSSSRQKLDKQVARDEEFAKATATAAKTWKLKLLPDIIESEQTAGEIPVGSSESNLDVSGLPLLDEDVEILVYLLRQNYSFKRLDLSRCFFSGKLFVRLAQALAWNCCIEELYVRECVLTEEIVTSALADVLTVNDNIHSVDLRGCRGLRKAGLDNILTAASRKSTLLTVNGMELAALRADDSDMLDFSRSALGYTEAIIVAHCLSGRADGLHTLDFHSNSLSTEAFKALMLPLRRQSSLRSLDLSWNEIDERALPVITELLHRNTDLSTVKLTGNRITCNEYEHYGLNLMKLLSSNTTVTVFDMDDNDISPKMLNIVAEKLAANRAVRRELTLMDYLQLKYQPSPSRPVLPDPRSRKKMHLHLENVDQRFMIQEGLPAVQIAVRTEHVPISTLDGVKLGMPLDFYFVKKRASPYRQKRGTLRLR